MTNNQILREDHRVEECCQAYLKGKIPSISLGVSGRCNFACLYCDRRSGKAKKNEIGPKEKIKILKKMIPYGIKIIDFCFEGEPLLDPAFWMLIEIANKNGVLPFTFSNLTQIKNIEIAKKLLKNNVTIAGKMDRTDNFDDLIGVKMSQYVVKGLDNLLKAGYPAIFEKNGQSYTKLSMVFVPTALNYTEAPVVAKKCKKLGIFLRVGKLEIVGRAEDNRKKLYLSCDKVDEVYQQVSDVFGYDYVKNYKACCFNLLGLFIGVDGKISVDQYGLSCPFIVPSDMGELETIYVGNALTDDIGKIWSKVENIRVKNIGKLEKRVNRLTKGRISVGCSGESYSTLKMAIDLIKEKHRLMI
jgi:MoaA/NifB/PqqE/SkfB family radical SAM enzyme